MGASFVGFEVIGAEGCARNATPGIVLSAERTTIENRFAATLLRFVVASPAAEVRAYKIVCSVDVELPEEVARCPARVLHVDHAQRSLR